MDHLRHLKIIALSIAKEAADILKEDASFFTEAYHKLPQIKTGSKGQILEWDEEYQEADIHHRHISLLYGLYPGNSFHTSELLDAARKTMELRGDEATGWSLAWKIRDTKYHFKISCIVI